MRRKIGTVIAALLLLSGSSLMCSAQTGGSPSAGQKGLAGSPKAEGIGSTSSTHNPSGSSSSTTGMENRTSTGSEMGTNTSTHNPSGKRTNVALRLSGAEPRDLGDADPIRE